MLAQIVDLRICALMSRFGYKSKAMTLRVQQEIEKNGKDLCANCELRMQSIWVDSESEQ